LIIKDNHTLTRYKKPGFASTWTGIPLNFRTAALVDEDAQFDLGPIQPTTLFRGVMNLEPFNEGADSGWFEGLVQGGLVWDHPSQTG